MWIRNLLLSIGLVFVLSACALGVPELTATNTPEPTLPPSATPTVTQTPTPSPTPSRTPTPTSTSRPVVVVPAACTNDLEFVADLSIPDGTAVDAGATITKTWRVRNAGTCTWNSNYTFRQIGGDALTANTIAAPVAGRGQIIDLSVTVTVGTNVGTYDDLERATFQMFNANGVPFGQTPYVEVAIQSPGNDDTCLESPRLTTQPNEIGVLEAGETKAVTYTIRNMGTCTWDGYTLEKLGSDSPLIATNLPLTIPVIAPQQSYTFTLNVQIANVNADFGLYSMAVALLNDDSENAGLVFEYRAEFATGEGCFWDSDFVEDVTIPDGTVVNVGQSFAKTWRLRNSGTCPWDDFSFVKIEDENNAFEIQAQSDTDRVTVPFVAPGDTVDITVTFILRNVSPGETTRATFQMLGVENTFFGTMPYVEVQAGN